MSDVHVNLLFVDGIGSEFDRRGGNYHNFLCHNLLATVSEPGGIIAIIPNHNAAEISMKVARVNRCTDVDDHETRAHQVDCQDDSHNTMLKHFFIYAQVVQSLRAAYARWHHRSARALPRRPPTALHLPRISTPRRGHAQPMVCCVNRL